MSIDQFGMSKSTVSRDMISAFDSILQTLYLCGRCQKVHLSLLTVWVSKQSRMVVESIHIQFAICHIAVVIINTESASLHGLMNHWDTGEEISLKGVLMLIFPEIQHDAQGTAEDPFQAGIGSFFACGCNIACLIYPILDSPRVKYITLKLKISTHL